MRKSVLKSMCLAIFMLCVTNIFAEERLITFSAGISTGIPFYGSESVSEMKDNFDNDARVIIGTLASININPIEQFTFFIGANTLGDFSWKGEQHLNFLHTDFPVGAKVYPGLGGLNLGLAYTLGFRADFIKTEYSGHINRVEAWGNGFRFHLEYNFAHSGQSQYLPSIGLAWNLMPRGNSNYDNIIMLYVMANF